MPIKSKGKGYPIPDNPEPEGYHCVRVYVPDDSLYIGIFWQALHYLASPRAWANDADHTAIVAAEVWKAAIQKSQEVDVCGGGECGIMDVRQSNSVPCKLEKKEDCSEEWEQFADMRLCVPKMRMVGGVLQQDTTGTGTWVDAGDPEEPYDPRIDAPYTPPWVTPPEGQDGKCLSASNVATYIDFCCYHIAGSMVDLLTFFETLSGAVTILTALMDLIPLTLLTAFITSLYTQVVDSWADVRDFAIIDKLTEILVCRYDADGSMTKASWTQVMADCNAWRDTLTDSDARAKWWIAIQLINLWGPVGMSIAGAIWGITEYDCEYNECAWEKVFTWDTSEESWYPHYNPGRTPNEAADFDPPNGWKQVRTIITGTGQWIYTMELERDFDPTYITDVDIDVTVPVHYQFTGISVDWKDSVGGYHRVNEYDPPQGDSIQHYDVDHEAYGLFITFYAIQAGAEPDPFYVGTMKDVTVQGTGISPF
jgi:hypothetical protein